MPLWYKWWWYGNPWANFINLQGIFIRRMFQYFATRTRSAQIYNLLCFPSFSSEILINISILLAKSRIWKWSKNKKGRKKNSTNRLFTLKILVKRKLVIFENAFHVCIRRWKKPFKEFLNYFFQARILLRRCVRI